MEDVLQGKKGGLNLGTAVGKKIAIIGSGFMGTGIALIFARNDYDIWLFDTQEKALAQAKPTIRLNLELMARHGIGDKSVFDSVLARVSTSLDLSEAVSDAQFVIECAPENLQLKQDLFEELDSLCPDDTVLATNTSVISITEIAEKAINKQRIIGTHFWNPPFLIPLVEVIRTEDTAEEVFEQTFRLLASIGKHPVRVNKDVPGFVANRLQHALWREAISIVERGIATADTVDECIRYGFGFRLPILGPLENSDMVGADLTLVIHKYILKHIENSPEPSPLLQKMVDEGNLGFKSGQGFYEWTHEESGASKKRLIEYLLKQLSS